jgi:beta-galactosidase
MNEAWWANFWNHTFTDWSQVPTFDESIDGLSLDWLRFTNDLHVSFFRNEMEPLRELTPDVPCTTNFMGTHEGTNYWQWSEHLDVISNDLYPMPDDREHTWQQSIASDFIHSMMRGMSGGKTWMLLECSPSSVNWGQINKLKRPGVHRQEVLQAVANGADTIHYFQWRKGRGGFEKYHGAVVDHEGSDQGRVYQECAAIGRELDSLESLCQQDLPQADIAIVYDWESRWALNASCGPKKAEAVHPYPSDIYTEACQAHYRALTVAGQSVDVLSAQSEFADYKVLVIPTLYMVSDALGARLQAFVDQGGILVGTYLTGYVDEMNRCHLGGFPGAGLRATFGIWNEEVDYLHDETEVLVVHDSGKPYPGVASDVVEVLHVETADVLARTGSEFYKGSSVITSNRSGQGSAYYLGAKLADASLSEFYASLLETHALSTQVGLPEGVVLRQRQSSQGTLTFLFNYTRTSQTFDLKQLRLREWASGEVLEGRMELEPYASYVCVDAV